MPVCIVLRGTMLLFLVFFVTLRIRYLLTYRAFKGCIIRTSIALLFIARFRCRLQCFFSQMIRLSEALHNSHIRC